MTPPIPPPCGCRDQAAEVEMKRGRREWPRLEKLLKVIKLPVDVAANLHELSQSEDVGVNK